MPDNPASPAEHALRLPWYIAAGPLIRGAASRDHEPCRPAVTRSRLRIAHDLTPGTYTISIDRRTPCPLITKTPRPWWSRPMPADVCSMFARMPRYAPAASGIRSALRIPATGQTGSSRHVSASFDTRSEGKIGTEQRTLNPLVRNSSLTAWPTVPYLLITSSLASSAATFRTGARTEHPERGIRGHDLHAPLSRERQATPAPRKPCPWFVRDCGLSPWPSVENRRLHRPSWRPDAVRYTSVDTATQRSTATQGDTPRDREETARIAAKSQLAGRFRR